MAGVREEGYKSQVAPGGHTDFGGASAAAFGAPIAEALGRAGSDLARSAAQKDRLEEEADEIERQRLRKAALSDGAARLAMLQGKLHRDAQDMRATYKPGAADHYEAISGHVAAETEKFFETIGDPEVAAALRPDAARLGESLLTAEHGFAIERRADKALGDVTVLVETLANNMFTNPTADNLKSSLELAGKAIDTLSVPDDAKANLRRDAERLFNLRGWQGAMERDPRAALEQLDKGVLNPYAEKGEIVALRNSAQASIDRLDAQARSAASASEQDFKEGARVKIEDLNRGVTVDPGELMTLAGQAKAMGDESLAQDLEDAAARAQVSAKYEGRSVAELAAARRDLETSSPKWREDRKLVAAHTQLGLLIDRTKARADDDALGLYIEQGGANGLPAFDLVDPGVMSRYFAAGDAAAKKFGRPPQYMPAEVAAELRENFAKGGAGDKAATIVTMAAYGNARAKGLMRQLAPAEPRYAALVDLASMRNRNAGQQLVLQALQGFEQIKANGKLVGGDIGNIMQSDMESSYGAALRMLPGPVRQGVNEVARALYAEAAVKGGIGGAALDKELWRRSVRQALGEAGDGTGGIGKARDGSHFVLPRGMSEGDYHTAVSRADAAAIMAAAGGDFPLWGGKPMRASEFKQHLMPVSVGDGLYMFRSGSGFARSGKHQGRNFVLDIRALVRASRR